MMPKTDEDRTKIDTDSKAKFLESLTNNNNRQNIGIFERKISFLSDVVLNVWESKFAGLTKRSNSIFHSQRLLMNLLNESKSQKSEWLGFLSTLIENQVGISLLRLFYGGVFFVSFPVSRWFMTKTKSSSYVIYGSKKCWFHISPISKATKNHSSFQWFTWNCKTAWFEFWNLRHHLSWIE